MPRKRLNMQRAAESARIALRKGNQAAEEAAHEARECEKVVELMKRDMPNSLTLFMKAMEKVPVDLRLSNFLSVQSFINRSRITC